jgi:hypothetical protein
MYTAKIGMLTQRKTDDSQAINPNFVEWLMGYPLNWTNFAPESAAL